METLRHVSKVLFLRARHHRSSATRGKLKKRLRVTAEIFGVLPFFIGANCVPALAASTDYDGKWDFQDSCFAATGVDSVDPFALQRTTTIEKGTFSDAYTSTLNGGRVEVSFIGTIKDSAITMFMDGKSASGVRWRETLDGHVASSTEIVFDGTHFNLVKDKWVLTHTCFGKLRILEPASVPLSASTASPAPASTPAPAEVAVPQVAAPAVTPVAASPASAATPAAAPVSAATLVANASPGPTAKAATTLFPSVSFDGTYSGPVVVSGMRTCEKTMARFISIVVKNNHFDTTIFNTVLAVDVPTNGVIDATGVRHADHAKTDLTGKVNDWTIELEMQNPYCKAHANLKAANGIPALAAATVAARPAPPRHRKWARTQAPGHGDHSTELPAEAPEGVIQH